MSSSPQVVLLLSGALAMGYLVAALFFFRFASQTGDRLFTGFGAAFALLAVQRVLVAFLTGEAALVGYALRVVAFLLILVAIIDKNRGKG